MTTPVADAGTDGPLDPNAASTGPDTDPSPRPEDDGGPDAVDESEADWAAGEQSRPTLPGETADGLDDMDEEMRRQAEDMPLDTPGRLR